MKGSAGASITAPKRVKKNNGVYDKLWKTAGASKGWAARCAKYWNQVPSDEEGMTGVAKGAGVVDLKFSHRALQDITKMLGKGSRKRFPTEKTVKPQRPFGNALEFGAGIGRVTKGVLMHFCDNVALVELVKKSLQKAKVSLPRAGDRFSFHHSSAQKFHIKARHYDLIWCQWLLMYLTDAEAIDVLKRSSAGLSASGKGSVLVVKENINESVEKAAETFYDEDYDAVKPGAGKAPVSLRRTRKHFEYLFKRAGLRIRGSRRMPAPPKSEWWPMRLWVLEPLKRRPGSSKLLA